MRPLAETNIPGPSTAILGGGAAGLALAAQLAAAGDGPVEVFEELDRLGGLHHSPLVDGVPYDIGTFVFDPAHEYLRLFPFLSTMLVPVEHTSVALKAGGEIDAYPLSFRGYARQHGLATCAADLADLLACKVRSRSRDTFRRYCTYYLGNGIYERTGLRSYVERLYALPENQIGLELARGRLAVLAEQCSLRRNGWSLLRRAFREGARPPSRYLVRPAGGFRQMYGAIGDALARAGVRVHLGVKLAGIERVEGGFRLRLPDKERVFDRVVSTIPLDTLARLVGVTPVFVPRTMQLVSLFYRYRGEPGFVADCLYNYSPDGAWKRVTMLSNYYERQDGEHRFVVECTAPGAETADVEGRRAAFEAHVRRWPVFREELDFRGGCVTPRAYPVYMQGEEAAMRDARRQMESTGILLTGRQGRFAYDSSAAVVRDSRRLAAGMAPRRD